MKLFADDLTQLGAFIAAMNALRDNQMVGFDVYTRELYVEGEVVGYLGLDEDGVFVVTDTDAPADGRES